MFQYDKANKRRGRGLGVRVVLFFVRILFSYFLFCFVCLLICCCLAGERR